MISVNGAVDSRHSGFTGAGRLPFGKLIWQRPVSSATSNKGPRGVSECMKHRQFTRGPFLDGGYLLSPLSLNPDINIEECHCRRGHPRDSRGMPQRTWTNFHQLFLHLARKSAHRLVVEPFWNCALLGLLQAFDRALLLQQVAFVLDFGLDGLEFVADSGSQSVVCRSLFVTGQSLAIKEFGSNAA